MHRIVNTRRAAADFVKDLTASKMESTDTNNKSKAQVVSIKNKQHE